MELPKIGRGGVIHLLGHSNLHKDVYMHGPLSLIAGATRCYTVVGSIRAAVGLWADMVYC